MIVFASLKEHFPLRKLEWIMAGWLATWGAYILAYPEMFTDPRTAAIFSGLNEVSDTYGVAGAHVWGWVAVIVGLARITALFINGLWRRSPVVRVVCAFISMYIVTQIVFGIAATGIPNTGIPTYTWLVIADLITVFVSGRDAVIAQFKPRRGVVHDDRSVGRA